MSMHTTTVFARSSAVTYSYLWILPIPWTIKQEASLLRLKRFLHLLTGLCNTLQVVGSVYMNCYKINSVRVIF